MAAVVAVVAVVIIVVVLETRSLFVVPGVTGKRDSIAVNALVDGSY